MDPRDTRHARWPDVRPIRHTTSSPIFLPDGQILPERFVPERYAKLAALIWLTVGVTIGWLAGHFGWPW
jgi:hypothetical protein